MQGDLSPGRLSQRVERITSSANPLLKEIRRAARAGGLTRDGCCIAEGWKLVEEAARSGCEMRALVISEEAWAWHAAQNGFPDALARVLIVPEKLFRDVAATESPQGILALVQPPESHIEQIFGRLPLVPVLDGLQDPGNTGTILRAAEAFGASGIVCLTGTVSPYNPKALRASAGSVFRVPLWLRVSAEEALARMGNLACFAADPHASEELDAIELRGPCALWIGSEGQGLRSELQGRARLVRIPTRGVESLNAATAASILLYEARRQRGWTE
jgi:RNA methyltransferase, TrmH family